MIRSPADKWVLWRTEHGTLTASIFPFLLLQLSVLLVFTTHFSWTGVAVCVAAYLVRMFAITGFYHRYFSHRTFKMGRAMQFIAGFIGATATQKGPLWWAAHHRIHHKESDGENDPHSSHRGFWHTHWLWFLYEENNEIDYEVVPDLNRYPELRLLDRFWPVPPVLLGLTFFLLGGWHLTVWGYFVSTFLLSNGTYTINSLMHYFGKQQYFTGDESRNHWLLAIITLGEGWHNNHHRYQASTRNGFFWYEYDITYYLLRLMAWCGLVRGLTPVPQKILEEGRLNASLRRRAKRAGHSFTPALLQRDEIPALLIPERIQALRGELLVLSDQVAERGSHLLEEWHGFNERIVARGQQLHVEIQTLGGQMAEQGRHLRDEVGHLGDQVADKGGHFRYEVQALSEHMAERARHLRQEVQKLSASGKHLREEIQALSEHLTETAGRLRREVQALGEQLGDMGGKLKEEIEELGGLLPDPAY